MKILHILDHSIPLQSGYTFRTRAILNEQRALGWTTTQAEIDAFIAAWQKLAAQWVRAA